MADVFDIAIVGGGLVGAAMALALSTENHSVVLLEGAGLPSLPARDDWDVRVYAISPGNKRFLQSLGAWQLIPASRLASVRKMHVRGDQRESQLILDAADAGGTELASIVENRMLQHALWQLLLAAPNVSVVCPGRLTSIEWAEESVSLRHEDGRELGCRLLIGADGAQSWVRGQAGIQAAHAAYGQKGVVANFACERPHRGVARQWFFDDGILAWLPLPGERMSMVWSVFDDKADSLLALDGRALCERVAIAGDRELGALTQLTPAAAFPLRLLRLSRTIGDRLALIGDAAHNVHPLAGQGVNLGFQDVRLLASLLNGPGAPADPGLRSVLRTYERGRKEDVLLMQLVTDGLQKLFNNRHPFLAGLRNIGLDVTGRMAPVRRLLIQHALG